MNIKNRLNKLRRDQINKQVEYIKSLPDAELEKIASKDAKLSKWLETLTDGELDTLVCEKQGYTELINKYDKYKQKNN